MEHESDGDTSCNWCARYSHQRIGTETGGRESERKGEREREVRRPCQRTEKIWNMKVTVQLPKIGTETGGFGNKRTS